MSAQTALAVVGGSVLGYAGIKTISALNFHLHSSKLARYNHGSEPWALVTGASDGIGLAFTNELAQRGFNVILHGRNEAKLKKLVAEFQQKYPKTGFKLLVLDAAAPATPEFDDTVLSAVAGLNLTVVIHNVAGSGTARPELNNFEDFSSGLCDGWIDINTRFPTQLTRILLPMLLKAQPALMVYVSSAVTEMTTPGVSIYTAAKCYIEGLARCLKMEMKVKGADIEIKSLTVGMVATASSGRHEEDISFAMPSTRDFVKSAFDKVGFGSVKVTPWVGHWLQLGFMTSLPLFIQEWMLLRMMRKVQEQMAKNK